MTAGSSWFVISGCSSGGKSSLLTELQHRGYAGIPEPGRRIVVEERAHGGSALPWRDPQAFAERALGLAMADREAASRLVGPVFLDRSVVDAVVALEHATGHPCLQLAADHRYGAIVFFAPPWPEIFVQDTSRRHGWEEAVAECQRLERGYAALGYTLVHLPKLAVSDRADFVLTELDAI